MPATQMTQLNVRVDADVKRRAEEVLALMGSSVTDLVRLALSKVARGAADYEEAHEALSGTSRRTLPDSEENETAVHPALAASWQAVDDLYRTLGVDPSASRVEERSAEQAYEEAMLARYAEKGWLA